MINKALNRTLKIEHYKQPVRTLEGQAIPASAVASVVLLLLGDWYAIIWVTGILYSSINS